MQLFIVAVLWPKRPTETFEDSAQLALGNCDTVRLVGSLSGPAVPGGVYAKFAVIRDRPADHRRLPKPAQLG